MAAKRLKELRAAIMMVSHLGDYYSGRLESAYWYALPDQNEGRKNARIRAALARSKAAWGLLSDSPEANYYKPFTERLRMHNNSFHWKSEMAALDHLIEKVPVQPADAQTPAHLPVFPPAPKSAALDWTARGNEIVCTLPARGLTAAWLLAKPLPSTTCFHKTPMKKNGAVFEARFERMNCGHLIAADVEFDGYVARIPSWENSEPYLIIPSLPGPTPLYYGSAEAMSYLKPEVLTPGKYGTLLLPTRSERFFQHFDLATQRKILDPVARGMRLVVLEQNYSEETAYPLDWLPVPPA